MIDFFFVPENALMVVCWAFAFLISAFCVGLGVWIIKMAIGGEG